MNSMTPIVTLESINAKIDAKIGGLSNIESIDLRLRQAAYRFELVELEHRVGNIERQIGSSAT